MANLYDITGLSYTAHENPEWFTRALFGGRVIKDGLVGVMTGIKGDELLSDIALDGKILQDDGNDCAWTPEQVIRLSEKTAKVVTKKINLEQCIDELENKRTLYQLSPGAKNEALPDGLEDATMQLIAIGLSNEIDGLVMGATTEKDKFDGLEPTLLKSESSLQLKGKALTVDNVLDAVASVYNALPERVIQNEKGDAICIVCSYNTRRLLLSALDKKNNQVVSNLWSVDTTDSKNPIVYYAGIRIEPVKGLDTNTIIAYDRVNVRFLTDLLSDTEEIELGQFPKPYENKIFVKGRLRMGVVVLFDDETVIYSTKVQADRLGE